MRAKGLSACARPPSRPPAARRLLHARRCRTLPTQVLLRSAPALLASPDDEMLTMPVIDEDGCGLDRRADLQVGGRREGKYQALHRRYQSWGPRRRGGPCRDDCRAACDSPPVQWFLARNYMVVVPMRRGYGVSEGGWAQNPGSCASPELRSCGARGRPRPRRGRHLRAFAAVCASRRRGAGRRG